MTSEAAIKYIQKWYQPTTELKEREKAIQALSVIIKAIDEVRQYRKIGTVEECRGALEKQHIKGVEFIHMLGDTIAMYKCPVCEKVYRMDYRDLDAFYCSKCGQKLQIKI